MKFLCIDTSDKPLHVALYNEGNISCKYDKDCGTQHSKTLLYAVDAILKENSLTAGDMDYFCAAAGPGSFTGIRIGVTTVRAFAQVFSKPVIGVNSLELKAYNVGIKGKVAVPLIEAGQGRVYYAVYENGEEILPHSVCALGELDGEVKSRLETSGIKEEITYVFEKEIDGVKKVVPPLPVPALAKLCLEKIARGKAAGYKALEPVYAALCQAEISYADRHKKVE